MGKKYMMKQMRFLLLPFSLVYGSILAIRNFLYNIGLLPSRNFKIPVISVGNLCVGGTGKSPQVEYLVRLLQNTFTAAILSRGYGRKTSGFLYASATSASTDVGDEPRQYKRKFPTVPVCVDASRVQGIKKLQQDYPELRAVLLDDALQYRALKPGISILLTQYNKLYIHDYVLPVGSLREFKQGARRADIIIITKCPPSLSPIEKRCLCRDIAPLPYQQVYFTKIIYGDLVSLWGRQAPLLGPAAHVVLLTGIANAEPLYNYVFEKTKNITHICYSDHHEYSIVELINLKEQFEKVTAEHKLIITTEKDAMRIDKAGLLEVVQELPLFYLPIQTAFLFEEAALFDKQITDYVKGNTKLSSVHQKPD
jgi:tetraacyldisaccharide 4'-kinase